MGGVDRPVQQARAGRRASGEEKEDKERREGEGERELRVQKKDRWREGKALGSERKKGMKKN